MTNLQRILDKHFKKLRSFPNVLNANIGEEITKGIKTGRMAIVVYVSKKKPLSKLRKKDRLPDYIEGIPIDVIEFSTPDFKLGDTKPSRLKPSIQKKIAGGVKK